MTELRNNNDGLKFEGVPSFSTHPSSKDNHGSPKRKKKKKKKKKKDNRLNETKNKLPQQRRSP